MIYINVHLELEKLLQKSNTDFEIIQNEKPIYSVNDAIGYYEICRTAPAFIITTERGYFAVLLSGDRGRIDFELIKKALHCENAKLASKKEVLDTVGYESGSVPLAGLPIPCILDKRLLQYPYVYGGIGDANFTLKINPRDLEKVNEIIALID